MNTNELHRMMIDALVAHDCQTMRDHYAPDYTYRGPDGEVGDVDVALGTVQMYCTAFPDLDVEDQPLDDLFQGVGPRVRCAGRP
jgi:hypothetical protein